MRIEASANLPAQTINISNIPDILSKLNIGDIVRAQILEITANELMLQLFDGSKINAASQTTVQAKTGDFVDFVLKDKNNGQIFLETLKGDETKQKSDSADIKKLLASIDIKPDAKNIELVKELKSNEIPFSKEIFMKAAELIKNIKSLTPEKAVFIASNDINPIEKNLTALKQLTDEKIRVGSEIDQIYKLLSNSQDKPSIDLILSKLSTITKQVPTGSNVLTEKLTESLNKSIELTSPIVQNVIKEEINNIKDTSLKNAFNKLDLEPKLENFVTTNYQLLTKENTQPIVEKTNIFLNSEFKGFEKLPEDLQNVIRNIFSDVINKTVKSKGINENKQFLNISEENLKPDNEQKQQLQRVFNDFFVKVESTNLKNDLNTKNIYKDLQHKLEDLKEAVNQSNISSKGEILAKIDSLDNSVRFINEVNHHNNYFQLPINMGDKNTTGELYILKRDSKKRKINPEDATMFLSLNTENIGQVDSLISVSKKNLSINMRVEDQRVIDFLKENYKELYDSMSQKGYKIVDIRYRITDGTDANIVNIKKIVGRELNKNISIDYKV